MSIHQVWLLAKKRGQARLPDHETIELESRH
jgi:hypothetical protein